MRITQIDFAISCYLSCASGATNCKTVSKKILLPLRTKIEAESLLTYNGMITNTFELLADTRAKIGTLLQSVNAKRDFWLADANLNAAIYGGGASAGGGGSAVTLADAGGGH